MRSRVAIHSRVEALASHARQGLGSRDLTRDLRDRYLSMIDIIALAARRQITATAEDLHAWAQSGRSPAERVPFARQGSASRHITRKSATSVSSSSNLLYRRKTPYKPRRRVARGAGRRSRRLPGGGITRRPAVYGGRRHFLRLTQCSALTPMSVIFAINERRPKIVERLHRELTAGTPMLVPAVVIFELECGCAKSNRREHSRRALEIFLSAGFDQPPFDIEDAREAGEIRAWLETRGQSIGPYDTLIARPAVN